MAHVDKNGCTRGSATIVVYEMIQAGMRTAWYTASAIPRLCANFICGKQVAVPQPYVTAQICLLKATHSYNWCQSMCKPQKQTLSKLII
jgi:hypothetical protein